MRKLKTKTSVILAILLMLSMSASTVLVPNATSHTPPWKIPTQAFVVAAPSTIGVGQTATVYMWLTPLFGAAGGSSAVVGTNGSTSSQALLSNNYRFHNFKLTTTDPNGKTTVQNFDVIQDTISSQYVLFTPDQVGTYTFNFTFPGQDYAQYAHYEGSVLVNDTYLPSSASTTLNVQANPPPPCYI